MKRSLIGLISSACIAIAIMGMADRAVEPITKAQADQAARKLLKIASLPDPKNTAQVQELPEWAGLRDRWEVIFPGEYRFTIRKDTGMIGGFQNHRRIEEQFKRTQERSVKRFTSANEAASHLHSLATKLGLRSQAQRTKLEYVRDGDPMKTDANRAGRIFVNYRTKPFGYEFFGPVLGNGMGFTIDPVDGALVTFAQAWDFKIESHAVNISKAKATASAEVVFRAYRKRHRSFHTTADQPVAKVKLKYVIPNAAYDSTYRDMKHERLARLAYIVYFGTESVWIDSATGKLLGGESFV